MEKKVMAKAFGLRMSIGEEIKGQFAVAGPLNWTLEDACRSCGFTIEFLDAYIETEAMPLDEAIAFCQMIEAQNKNAA